MKNLTEETKTTKQMIIELNRFYKDETKDFNNTIVIYPFNKVIRYGKQTTLFKTTKEFKNCIHRLYHGQYLNGETENIRKLYPSTGTKGHVLWKD